MRSWQNCKNLYFKLQHHEILLSPLSRLLYNSILIYFLTPRVCDCLLPSLNMCRSIIRGKQQLIAGIVEPH